MHIGCSVLKMHNTTNLKSLYVQNNPFYTVIFIIGVNIDVNVIKFKGKNIIAMWPHVPTKINDLQMFVIYFKIKISKQPIHGAPDNIQTTLIEF